jgi:TolB-like protein/DNA-binding winged helix-turn-helix (wHTH) protein/Tfp pilus assembly protein PilF
VNQAMIPADRTAFRIGDWRIEPALDEIARNGVTAKLEPRRMRVLVCLAEHAGEVVSVEQLLDAVWKDVVVTHDSVYQAVAGLRRALGDDQKNPIYIANVQRRGYRLVAPVAPAEPGQISLPPHNDSSAHADAQQAQTPATQGVRGAAAVLPRSILMWAGATLMVIALLGALFWSIRWREPRPAFTAAPAGQATPQRATIPAAAFVPPPHSIAVLPFVNISGDKEQDYFSDGLTDELLSSLARINQLQVTGRTSAFYFKGEHADLSTIARKLNVAAILEGSVRRSEHTVRVSTQLINAVNGFGLWSATYDRDLGDVLKVQTEIATEVASALRVTLLGNEAAKIELGGTRNPAAFDAFLRATRLYHTQQGVKNQQAALEAAIASYTDAIRLDPEYALAYADRSLAMGVFITQSAKGPALRGDFDKARSDARHAIALAPDLAEGHLALASLLQNSLDFAGATREYDRAIALAPGNARVLTDYGQFAVTMGKTEAGLAAVRQGVVLDPLNYLTHWRLGASHVFARRYDEAIASLTNAKALPQNDPTIDAWIGVSYYLTGDFASAQRGCASANSFSLLICMAITDDKLARRSDAEAMLAKLRALRGDNFAVVYAMIYAQWGDRAQALEWLDTGMRLHDPWLQWLRAFPLFDPLRKEPRFQAIERELKFPN